MNGCKRTLSTDDLHEVNAQLNTVALEWYHLGLALGLKSSDLDVIKADNRRTVDCFTEMLKAWLQNTLPEPTWGDLAEALNSIGEAQLSHNMRVKYCGMREPPGFQQSKLQGKQNQRRAACYKILFVFIASATVLCLSWILSQYQAHIFVGHESHLSQECRVPYLPADVIGRDTDAENVTKLIGFGNSKVRIISLVGPPGIGKSTLAKYVGHDLVKNSRVIVYYIDMNQITNVPAMTEKLLNCAEMPSQKGTTVQNWARMINCYTLLLLDNADNILQTDWDNFETIIQVLLESTPHIKVLITSQKQQFFIHLSPVYEELRLNVLSTQHACALLHGMTSALTPQQAETIAELTGSMPLALTVIGALIKKLHHNSWPRSAENIINELRKEPFLTFSQTSTSINASISVSYEYLDKELKWFIHFIANFPGSFDDVLVTEIMSIYNMTTISKKDVVIMLQRLLEGSLLEYNRERNCYNFHSVIRTYIIGIRGMVEIDQIKFSIAFQDYYANVAVNLTLMYANNRKTAITRYIKERHNIEHFFYLFEMLDKEHPNYTTYFNALATAVLQGPVLDVYCRHALTYWNLDAVQQVWMNIKLYDSYIEEDLQEKAKNVLHELSRLFPTLESVTLSNYTFHKDEMWEIIRFFIHQNLSRAVALTEKQVLAFEQQTLIISHLNATTWHHWKELLYRIMYRNNFNKTAELGSTMIRAYEKGKRQYEEAVQSGHTFYYLSFNDNTRTKVDYSGVSIDLLLVYYYTAVAMYRINGSVDYLLSTLDVIKNSNITSYYIYQIRLRVCWVLAGYGHQSCINQLFSHIHESVRPILLMALILAGFIRYTQWFEVIPLLYDKHVYFIFILILIVLDSYHHIVPNIILDIVLVLGMAIFPGRSCKYRYYVYVFLILCFLTGSILLLFKILIV